MDEHKNIEPFRSSHAYTYACACVSSEDRTLKTQKVEVIIDLFLHQCSHMVLHFTEFRI